MSLKSDSSSSLEKFQGKFGGLAGAVISSYSDGEYELYVVDAGRLLPQEVIELRTQVYVNEWKIMTSENIVGNDDDSGIHVIVFHRKILKIDHSKDVSNVLVLNYSIVLLLIKGFGGSPLPVEVM